jgi:hypothetical protein
MSNQGDRKGRPYPATKRLAKLDSVGTSPSRNL